MDYGHFYRSSNNKLDESNKAILIRFNNLYIQRAFVGVRLYTISKIQNLALLRESREQIDMRMNSDETREL